METSIISYTSSLASDALGVSAYDEDTSTYVKLTSGIKKIYVNSSMWNKDIYLTLYTDSTSAGSVQNQNYIKYCYIDGTTSTYKTFKSDITFTKKSIKIPENLKYIIFESGTGSAYYLNIYEIQLSN